MNTAKIYKELEALHALGAELVERTSRLKKEIVPVEGRSPRKGRVKQKTKTQLYIERKNRRIGLA